MLSAGLTLVRALDILSKEQTKDGPKQVLSEIYEEVQKGTSFSDALKMQGAAFPNFFISMVQAGEASGSMDLVMKRLEDNYAKDAKLNNKIKGALTYPIILAVLAILIMAALMTFILPTFRTMMTDEDMVGITKLLFSFSDSLRQRWYIYIIAIVVIVIAIKYIMKIPSVRFQYDRIICKMPKVGPLVVKVYTGRFARTLANLYSAGIPMVECLERSSAILNNMFIEDAFGKVIDEVKQGDQLSAAIGRTGIFESMFCSIIFVGEESGSLDTILGKTADFYEDESDAAIQRLVSFIEPAMIIIMGAAVGLVIGSILPALYKSMGNIASM
jgi:type IV pilus assembly protein PilC